MNRHALVLGALGVLSLVGCAESQDLSKTDEAKLRNGFSQPLSAEDQAKMGGGPAAAPAPDKKSK